MKKVILSVTFLIAAITFANAQKIKMRASRFAFVPKLSDSLKSPIYLANSSVVVFDYDKLRVTFHSQLLEESYDIIREVETAKGYHRYDCIDPGGEKCVMIVNISQDETVQSPIEIKIVGKSIRYYRLSFL